MNRTERVPSWTIGDKPKHGQKTQAPKADIINVTRKL